MTSGSDTLGWNRTPPFPGPAAYFRLHGQGGYRYTYTAADLGALAAMAGGRQTTYVLFNNLSMWPDALQFKARLGSAGPPG